jgi:hypothetical protein
MALDAQQVDELQNRTPTDWTKFDQNTPDINEANGNRFALDGKLHVKWYMRPRLNVEKSTEANRAIYEDTEYIEIMMPGEKHNIVQRPAWSQDYERFAAAYKLFKEGRAEQDIGTPLRALPFLSESQIEELHYLKIRTVEKLATLSDSAMQNFMGARELQQKADAFLKALSSGENMHAENEALKKRLSDLEAMLDKSTAPAKGKQAANILD